jgi:hypothetical protein
LELQEHFKRPTVYLDHWALNIISGDTALRDKFVTMMNKNGGTFRLSVSNVVEMGSQGDKTQVYAILDMIQNIDDCGLINIDPSQVIRIENSLISDPSLRYNPSAELGLVEAFLLAHNYPRKWHVSEIIRSVLPSLPSKNMTKNSAEFLKDMQALLKVGRENERHFLNATARFKAIKAQGSQYQTATRELWQMANAFIMRNKDMKMSKYSEWTDLFHVIVPVAYCDAVLIDKRWKTFIAQTGFSYPKIARVFDNKSLEDFFQQIENGNLFD